MKQIGFYSSPNIVCRHIIHSIFYTWIVNLFLRICTRKFSICAAKTCCFHHPARLVPTHSLFPIIFVFCRFCWTEPVCSNWYQPTTILACWNCFSWLISRTVADYNTCPSVSLWYHQHHHHHHQPAVNQFGVVSVAEHKIRVERVAQTTTAPSTVRRQQ